MIRTRILLGEPLQFGMQHDFPICYVGIGCCILGIGQIEHTSYAYCKTHLRLHQTPNLQTCHSRSFFGMIHTESESEVRRFENFNHQIYVKCLYINRVFYIISRFSNIFKEDLIRLQCSFTMFVDSFCFNEKMKSLLTF